MVSDESWKEVYEEMGIKVNPLEKPSDDILDDYTSDIFAYKERNDYREAQRICEKLEELYEVTKPSDDEPGNFFIMIVDDRTARAAVSAGRRSSENKLLPAQIDQNFEDFYEKTLAPVDLVYENCRHEDVGKHLLELFEEVEYVEQIGVFTHSETPELVMPGKRFSELETLQGAWLAPGLGHLYDYDEIVRQRRETE